MLGICRPAIFAGFLSASVVWGFSSAMAGSDAPSASQIIEALKPRASRGLSVKPTQAEIEKARVLEVLKSKAATRGLSEPERAELANVVQSKPAIDLVIYFEFNSSQISPRSASALAELGKALKDQSLKDASILLAGHTDAKGKEDYNQNLSERRAQAVRDYLIKNHGVSASFTVVGYGAEKLKVPGEPYSGKNRRVQIVNLTDNRVSNAGAAPAAP